MVMLTSLMCLGGFLRLSQLGATGFWLDEILNTTRITPEHVPFDHALVRLGVALHHDEASMRLPFALVGIATIWLVYRATRIALARPESLFAAALLTMAPLHVYHSREVKPYALLVAACALGFGALLHLASDRRDMRQQWRWHLLFALAAVLLILFSSNGLLYLVALMSGYMVLIVRAPTWKARMLHMGCVLGVSVLSLALFWRFYGGIVSSVGYVALLPPMDLMGRLAQSLVSGFTEDRTPSTLLLLEFAAAAIGAVGLFITQPLNALIAILTCILGFFVPIVILRLEGHGLAARYELPALIPLILLTAAGVGTSCRAVARLVPTTPGARLAIALALMSAIGVSLVEAQYSEVLRATHWNADWRRIATFIKQRAHPDDVVITSNDWGYICLEYYLPRVGARVRLENAQESIARAKELMAATGQGFIIAGGFHANRSIREWLDPFPMLATWRTEQIQLSYFPDRAAYLFGRLPLQELTRDAEAFWTSRAALLTFGDSDDRFLLDGWSASEHDRRQATFRWVDGTHARVYLPVRDHSPRTLRLRLMPFGPTTPGQTLALSLNDAPIARVNVDPGWHELSIGVTDAPWRHGANILTLDLGRAVSPAEVQQGGDPRHLSCAFSLLRAES